MVTEEEESIYDYLWNILESPFWYGVNSGRVVCPSMTNELYEHLYRPQQRGIQNMVCVSVREAVRTEIEENNE